MPYVWTKDNTVTNERAEPEAVEEAPVVKSRLSFVVMLSMVLGVLLAAGAVGTFLHFRSNNELQAKVLAVQNELKQKKLALDEAQAQIVALSGQIYVLKEYSIARSSRAGRKDAKVENGVAAADAGANAVKSVECNQKPGTAEVSPRTKKPKSDKPNCELVGKSPEEQAATLKRCVTMFDSSK